MADKIYHLKPIFDAVDKAMNTPITQYDDPVKLLNEHLAPFNLCLAPYKELELRRMDWKCLWIGSTAEGANPDYPMIFIEQYPLALCSDIQAGDNVIRYRIDSSGIEQIRVALQNHSTIEETSSLIAEIIRAQK